MSVTTVETGTSSQSTANIYNDAISEIKHQRVKRATIDRLDAALEQPMSKEALAVECSTHFTHSKSIIDIRNNMIEATTKARIEEVKSASPAKKYNFNVAKSMKSSGRKNEEEEAHRELKLGALDVWALGDQPFTILISLPPCSLNQSLNSKVLRW